MVYNARDFPNKQKKNGLQQNTDILVAFHAYATL